MVRKLRARRGDRPGPPPRPAHEIALERLDRLGAYGLLEDADNRPFYFAVSEVIRDYLGARYGFDSLEMTTDELVAELQGHAGRDLASFMSPRSRAGCRRATGEVRRRCRRPPTRRAARSRARSGS